jgi:hypothetical protein
MVLERDIGEVVDTHPVSEMQNIRVGARLSIRFVTPSPFLPSWRSTGISGAPFLLLVLGMTRLSCAGTWIAVDQERG